MNKTVSVHFDVHHISLIGKKCVYSVYARDEKQALLLTQGIYPYDEIVSVGEHISSWKVD
jgi:hypothetical protein